MCTFEFAASLADVVSAFPALFMIRKTAFLTLPYFERGRDFLALEAFLDILRPLATLQADVGGVGLFIKAVLMVVILTLGALDHQSDIVPFITVFAYP